MQTLRPVLRWLPIIMLGACTSLPERGRHVLVGMALPDLLSCVGHPNIAQKIGDHEYVLSYSPTSLSSPSLSSSVPVMGDLIKPTVTLTDTKTCSMTVRVQDAHVVSVHYVAASSMFSGPNSACTPLVRDCIYHPEHTDIPDDYDVDAVLGTKPAK